MIQLTHFKTPIAGQTEFPELMIVFWKIQAASSKLRTLARYSQLSHKIGCHVEERVWAGDFFLLVLEALADRMPFSIALSADDILVPVAFEVDHIVILLKLVELDIDKDPDSVRNVGETASLTRR